MDAALLLVLALLLAAAGATRRSTGRRARPGRSAAACSASPRADDVPTLDPALGYDSRSWTFEQHLFETLVTYDDANGIVPLLAERWDGQRRPAPLSLHAACRTSSFSDGTPLTAADAVGSLERVLDPRTRSQGAEYYRGIRGAREFVAGTAPHVERAPRPRRHARSTIELDEPDPLFLDKLALLFAVGRAGRARAPARRRLHRPADRQRPVRAARMAARRAARAGPQPALPPQPDRPYLDGIVEYVGVNTELAWLQVPERRARRRRHPAGGLSRGDARPGARGLSSCTRTDALDQLHRPQLPDAAARRPACPPGPELRRQQGRT